MAAEIIDIMATAESLDKTLTVTAATGTIRPYEWIYSLRLSKPC